MKYLRAGALLVVLSATSVAPAQTGGQQGLRGDLAKGRPIAETVCAACHGPDGNSSIPVNPSLAGQHPGYLYKQLADFKTGRRKNAAMCLICGFIYDESAGLPEEGIPAGTKWDDVPVNWVCPECGARKEDFELIEV